MPSFGLSVGNTLDPKLLLCKYSHASASAPIIMHSALSCLAHCHTKQSRDAAGLTMLGRSMQCIAQRVLTDLIPSNDMTQGQSALRRPDTHVIECAYTVKLIFIHIVVAPRRQLLKLLIDWLQHMQANKDGAAHEILRNTAMCLCNSCMHVVIYTGASSRAVSTQHVHRCGKTNCRSKYLDGTVTMAVELPLITPWLHRQYRQHHIGVLRKEVQELMCKAAHPFELGLEPVNTDHSWQEHLAHNPVGDEILVLVLAARPPFLHDGKPAVSMQLSRSPAAYLQMLHGSSTVAVGYHPISDPFVACSKAPDDHCQHGIYWHH